MITGILFGKYVIHFPLSIWMTFLFFFTSLAIIRTPVLNLMLLVTLISAAALRYHLATVVHPTDHITTKDVGRISQFEGVIIDYQYRNDDRNKYVVSLKKVVINDTIHSTNGQILLYTKKIQKKFHYGEGIRVQAPLEVPSIKRNPGQFDYRQYCYNQDIFYISQIMHRDSITIVDNSNGIWFLRFIIIPLREYCQKTFQTHLDKKTAGLIMALILGEKQELDRHMINNFKKVGVVHVLAISGLHVGFIITFIFSLLSILRLNTHSKIWGLLLVLIVYIILVRFKTPVIRASSMAILYLIAQVLERKISTYNIIFAAMTIILLFEPRELFNPGFHFSFMAVFSIIYGYERLDRLFPLNQIFAEKIKRNSWLLYFKKGIWIPILVSLAAVIGTSPLTLYYYGLFPSYAVFANLVVIPLTGIIVFLSLFLLFVGGLSNVLAGGLGQMIRLINQQLQEIVGFFADLPFSALVTPTPTFIQIILFYLFILSLIHLRINVKLNLIVLFTTAFIFFLSVRSGIKRDLQITFLDVGQGDAAFIRFPNQKTMLIDAGNRSFNWDQGEKTVLPYLQSVNALHINYLVGSHAHNDHIGGFLTLLNTLSIDTLVLSAYQFKSKFYNTLLSKSIEKNIPIKTAFKGDVLKPDSTCRVYILHPDSAHIRSETFSGTECNNSSLVMKISFGENSVLLTGDLEKSGEKPLFVYENFLESEILKIGHHGSSTSSSEELLERVNPIVAIISVAKKNKFRHPSPKTLAKLNSYGIRTYQTKYEGAIVFSIGPERITKINWK
jgi:competence protein ComEC